MLKSLLKAVGLLAILAWSGFAFAVGMGSINVTSALGRPLKAEIALVALENTDKSTITVRLASPSEFKSAGVDYPYALPKMKFEVETGANGEPYIKITTTQPVNEPFVSLLLELSWPAGKLMREYTFLLDPEGFVAEQPKMAEVVPVEPVAPMAAASATPADVPALPVEPVAAEPAAAITPVPVLAATAGEQAAAPAEALAPAETAPGVEEAALVAASAPAQAEPAETLAQADVAPDMEAKDLAADTAPAKDMATEPVKESVAADTVAVKRGDTLGKIAAQVKPVDVSLERMVVALYHANNKEFDGKNMNRIRAGKILRMPEPDDVSKVTQVAAVKEIRAHVADWQAYRQKLAAAPGKATEPTAKQADAGKISTAVAEKAPAAKEPAKEVLKLSKGEAPGDKQVAAGVASKQEKRIAKADDALAREKQLQEEQKRIADLEKIRKEGSKLVELKTQAAETKPAPATTPSPAASAVPTAKPKVIMPAQEVVAPASLLDEMLAEPLYLAGAAVVLLGLGGLGFVAVRRLRSQGGKKKSEVKKEFKIEPIGTATGSWVAPVPPSPETGDFTQSAAPSAQAAASSAAAPAEDDVDPIGEAELFLNFGRDTQAEEVLKEALIKNPSNIPVKLKLLSIYASRKDATTFSKYAREIQQSGDAAAWEQASAMGRAVDPTNPTYGGGPGAQPEAASAAEPAVDFDLGFGKPAAAATPAKEFSMDFDVTGTHPGVASQPADTAGGVVDVSGILPGEVARSAQETPMDFDVSGILPGEVMKAAQKAEMDFDISSTQILKAPPVATMDFDVTGGADDLKAPPAAAAPALNFGDLVFEMPSSQPKAEEPAKPAPAPAADDGLAFMIDFPMSEPAPAQKEDTASKLDIDFADISLNLDAAAPSSAGDAKSEHWHEVATKLDLAKAYQEMGDAAGAREILDEVVRDGDEQQREAAEKLLQQLSA